LENHSRLGNPLRRLWRFAIRQIVDDPPDDIAICEFDCRKGQCVQNEWDSCDRRIHKGAGELFPASDAPRFEGGTQARKGVERRIGGS
jgi:hypothetical protein